MVIRCSNPVVYEGINTTTVWAFPPILSPSSVTSSSSFLFFFFHARRARRVSVRYNLNHIWAAANCFTLLLSGNLPRAIKNYKPRGNSFFHTPDVEHMIKECKFLRVTSGQLDLSFMHWFTSKSLRQDSLRHTVCDQSTPLFVHSILSLLFILCCTVTIQISCIIGRVKDILILPEPCPMHKTRNFNVR